MFVFNDFFLFADLAVTFREILPFFVGFAPLPVEGYNCVLQGEIKNTFSD